MAETVTLTTPVAKPSIVSYTLDYFVLDVGNARVTVVVKSDTNETIQKVYDGTTIPTGASLLTTLNVSNNSAGNSLVKKMFTRLITDGVIVGTVGGTAQ